MHGRGGQAWQGGMYGSRDVHGGGVHGRGGHAWQRWACVAGGMHGRGGAFVAGDVHGRGTCMAHMPPPPILRDTVNERAVRILLECILVLYSLVCKFLTQVYRLYYF